MRSFILFFLLICNLLFSQESPIVYVLEYEGVINPVSSDIIRSAIETANEEGAECLIIELDTPGGLMKSMQITVKDILAAPLPVVIYVSPSGSHAASAGVFITYAAHVAAMAPGTNIGAAHPVTLGANADTSSVMMEKVVNDAVAFLRSIAEKRGRNADWAEESIREKASIPASEALKLGVIDVIASNVDSLVFWLNGKTFEVLDGKKTIQTQNAKILPLEISWRFKILNIISDPNIAYILLLIGLMGIFFELQNPGAILPGVVGGISLILAFYAMHTLPVNYAGILLILLAIILFIAEIKIPSYGMLTVGGIVSLALGSVMLFKTSLPFLQISWKIIAFATVITALFFLFVVSLGIRAQRRKPSTGEQGMIGEIATVIDNFTHRKGQVSTHGEIWEAESEEILKKGDRVKVVSMKNLVLFVKKDKT